MYLKVIKNTLALSLSFVLLSTSSSWADAKTGPTLDDYNWWRSARFGIFVHWGPSSILELGSGSWTRGKDYPEPGIWKQRSTNRTTYGHIPESITNGEYLKWKRRNNVPQEIYDNLFQIFNPVKFNAEAWAETFKEAGANYIVMVTKHHDGFCMFETQETDYNIMNTPFARDVAKELSEACQKRGIEVIWYYSAPDWYDARYDLDNIEPYVDYVTAQINELFGNYPNIRGVWWDGGVKCDTTKIFDAIYKHVDHPIYNARGFKSNGIRFGTPEQKLGTFNMRSPWESCACITDCNWFWDGGRGIKSAKVCLRMLIDAAGGDGNLLLDFGPTPEGVIYEPIRQVYLGMGKWLKKNGESIYGTRGGPYTPGSWGVATRKDRNIFLHVTQVWPAGVLELPALPAKILSAKTMDGKSVKFRQTDEGLTINLPAKRHDPLDTIIVLETKVPALDIPIVETPLPPSLTDNVKATASSERIHGAMGSAASVVFTDDEKGDKSLEFGEDDPKQKRRNKPQINPKKLKEHPWLRLHRGHFWRCWLAETTDPKPWLEVDFEKPLTFQRIALREKVSRIDAFEISIQLPDETWKTIYKGKDLGTFSLLLPKPVTAQKVRLTVTAWHEDETDQGPGIHTFDVYEK